MISPEKLRDLHTTCRIYSGGPWRIWAARRLRNIPQRSRYGDVSPLPSTWRPFNAEARSHADGSLEYANRRPKRRPPTITQPKQINTNGHRHAHASKSVATSYSEVGGGGGGGARTAFLTPFFGEAQYYDDRPRYITPSRTTKTRARAHAFARRCWRWYIQSALSRAKEAIGRVSHSDIYCLKFQTGKDDTARLGDASPSYMRRNPLGVPRLSPIVSTAKSAILS